MAPLSFSKDCDLPGINTPEIYANFSIGLIESFPPPLNILLRFSWDNFHLLNFLLSSLYECQIEHSPGLYLLSVDVNKNHWGTYLTLSEHPDSNCRVVKILESGIEEKHLNPDLPLSDLAN